jgi:hypothetical protein
MAQAGYPDAYADVDATSAGPRPPARSYVGDAARFMAAGRQSGPETS